REHREHDAAPHHDGNVAAVGVAGKEELRAEAGEEPGGDDQAELRAGEAKSVAQVRKERVDRSVAQRHAAGDEAVREKGADTEHSAFLLLVFVAAPKKERAL